MLNLEVQEATFNAFVKRFCEDSELRSCSHLSERVETACCIFDSDCTLSKMFSPHETQDAMVSNCRWRAREESSS
jgi:hypothetical protein